MRKFRGGQVRRLVGRVEAVPPRDESWDWSVRWDCGDLLDWGMASSRCEAVRAVRAAMGNALDSLPCYCVLSDGENLDLRTEYYRVVEVFIPSGASGP
jgi:hypothetical protein